MEDVIIKFNNVIKDYVLGKTKVRALKKVSFEIKRGEFLSIVGPSGSGKTTILNLIGCIDYPTEGDVYVKNKKTTEMSDSEASEFRNRTIGFIFQNFNLIPVLNVYENVEYPLLIRKGRVTKSDKEKIYKLIDEVGLKDFIKHKPEELSGGQRQRVAIARALVTEPDIVIADEPTANLDHKTSSIILELMKKMNKEYNVTFIFSTHDELVMKYAKRKIRLFDGEIVGES